MSDISKIETGGAVRTIKDEAARNDNLLLFQQANGFYKGRDLTAVFASEIAKYTDAWAWIKARIRAANFTGIYVGDYIPITVEKEILEMQVAGIDSYYKTTDQQLGHHIDFISRDCYSPVVKWNTTNNNNGNSTNGHPYMVSNLHTWLTTTVYNLLPEAVKNQITNKRSLMEVRYSASGALTDSTSWDWQDMGPLWVPHEFEVFGSVVWGTPGWSQGQALQYPIFANNYLNRIKGAGRGGSRCNWWLASVGSGLSTTACTVDYHGSAGSIAASDDFHVPLCFRIAA